jgi:hypothetical protein
MPIHQASVKRGLKDKRDFPWVGFIPFARVDRLIKWNLENGQQWPLFGKV